MVFLRSSEATKSLAFAVSCVVKTITTSFGSSDERKTRGLVRPADLWAPTCRSNSGRHYAIVLHLMTYDTCSWPLLRIRKLGASGRDPRLALTFARSCPCEG